MLLLSTFSPHNIQRKTLPMCHHLLVAYTLVSWSITSLSTYIHSYAEPYHTFILFLITLNLHHHVPPLVRPASEHWNREKAPSHLQSISPILILGFPHLQDLSAVPVPFQPEYMPLLNSSASPLPHKFHTSLTPVISHPKQPSYLQRSQI